MACGEYIAARTEKISSRSRKEERCSGLNRRKANGIGVLGYPDVETQTWEPRDRVASTLLKKKDCLQQHHSKIAQ